MANQFTYVIIKIDEFKKKYSILFHGLHLLNFVLNRNSFNNLFYYYGIQRVNIRKFSSIAITHWHLRLCLRFSFLFEEKKKAE